MKNVGLVGEGRRRMPGVLVGRPAFADARDCALPLPRTQHPARRWDGQRRGLPIGQVRDVGHKAGPFLRYCGRGGLRWEALTQTVLGRARQLHQMRAEPLRRREIPREGALGGAQDRSQDGVARPSLIRIRALMLRPIRRVRREVPIATLQLVLKLGPAPQTVVPGGAVQGLDAHLAGPTTSRADGGRDADAPGRRRSSDVGSRRPARGRWGCPDADAVTPR
jgi:hypothetical protein